MDWQKAKMELARGKYLRRASWMTRTRIYQNATGEIVYSLGGRHVSVRMMRWFAAAKDWEVVK